MKPKAPEVEIAAEDEDIFIISTVSELQSAAVLARRTR
jgi:hypothetical protein